MDDKEKRLLYIKKWDEAIKKASHNESAHCPDCENGQIIMVGKYYYKCDTCGASSMQTVKLDMKKLHDNSLSKK